MDPEIVLAIFGFATLIITSIATPLVLETVRDKRAAAKEMRDYRRQDEVARRVETAAKAAALKAEETAALVAETAKTADDKLDVIHTLVNSGMTASEQRAYDAMLVSAAVTRELIAIKRANGIEPSEETLNALAATESTLRDLREVLDQKQTAARVVDRQQKIALASPAREKHAADTPIGQAIEAGEEAGAKAGGEAAAAGAEAGAAAAAKTVLEPD